MPIVSLDFTKRSLNSLVASPDVRIKPTSAKAPRVVAASVYRKLEHWLWPDLAHQNIRRSHFLKLDQPPVSASPLIPPLPSSLFATRLPAPFSWASKRRGERHSP